MWRSFFLAIGICLCIVGAECLVIERAYLKPKQQTQPPTQVSLFGGSPVPPARREWVPPEWAPWTMLSGGAVVVLYSFTLPRRVAS